MPTNWVSINSELSICHSDWYEQLSVRLCLGLAAESRRLYSVTSLHVTAAAAVHLRSVNKKSAGLCTTAIDGICPSRRVFRILLSKNAETSYTLLFWPQILIFLGPGVFLAFCLFPAQMGTFTPSLTSFCWPPPACDCGALYRFPYRSVLHSVMIVFTF